MLKEIPEEGHRLARRTQETLIEKTRARAQDRVPASILRWDERLNATQCCFRCLWISVHVNWMLNWVLRMSCFMHDLIIIMRTKFWSLAPGVCRCRPMWTLSLSPVWSCEAPAKGETVSNWWVLVAQRKQKWLNAVYPGSLSDRDVGVFLAVHLVAQSSI